MNTYVLQVLDTAVTKISISFMEIYISNREWHPKLYSYQSLEATAIADVTLLSEGRHPPGNIYSFMKSELCLYSS